MTEKAVIIPIEPGFVWLRRPNGVWTGWEHPPEIAGGKLVEVGAVRVGRGNYRIFFYYFEPVRENSKWKVTFTDEMARHFDHYSLPLRDMKQWTAKLLPRLLRDFGMRPE